VEWVTAPAPGFGEGPRFGRRLQAQAGREVQVTAKGPIQPRSHVGFFRLTREKKKDMRCVLCVGLLGSLFVRGNQFVVFCSWKLLSNSTVTETVKGKRLHCTAPSTSHPKPS
jgi:hypothetical protein